MISIGLLRGPTPAVGEKIKARVPEFQIHMGHVRSA